LEGVISLATKSGAITKVSVRTKINTLAKEKIFKKPQEFEEVNIAKLISYASPPKEGRL